MDRWTDPWDAVATHWAIWRDNRIVAAARLSIHNRLSELPNAEIFEGVLSGDLPGPIGSLNRLVVAPEMAGQGLSLALDKVRIDHARDCQCLHLVGETYAGMKRMAQLESFGFQRAGLSAPYASGPLSIVKRELGGRFFSSSNCDLPQSTAGADIVMMRLTE